MIILLMLILLLYKYISEEHSNSQAKVMLYICRQSNHHNHHHPIEQVNPFNQPQKLLTTTFHHIIRCRDETTPDDTHHATPDARNSPVRSSAKRLRIIATTSGILMRYSYTGLVHSLLSTASEPGMFGDVVVYASVTIC